MKRSVKSFNKETSNFKWQYADDEEKEHEEDDDASVTNSSNMIICSELLRDSRGIPWQWTSFV